MCAKNSENLLIHSKETGKDVWAFFIETLCIRQRLSLCEVMCLQNMNKRIILSLESSVCYEYRINHFLFINSVLLSLGLDTFYNDIVVKIGYFCQVRSLEWVILLFLRWLLTSYEDKSINQAVKTFIYRVGQNKRGHSTFSQISRKLLKISEWFFAHIKASVCLACYIHTNFSNSFYTVAPSGECWTIITNTISITA